MLHEDNPFKVPIYGAFTLSLFGTQASYWPYLEYKGFAHKSTVIRGIRILN